MAPRGGGRWRGLAGRAAASASASAEPVTVVGAVLLIQPIFLSTNHLGSISQFFDEGCVPLTLYVRWHAHMCSICVAYLIMHEENWFSS